MAQDLTFKGLETLLQQLIEQLLKRDTNKLGMSQKHNRFHKASSNRNDDESIQYL